MMRTSCCRSLRPLACALFLAAPLAAQSTMAHDSMAMKSDSMHGMMMEHAIMQPHGMFAGAHDHTVSGSFSVAEKNGKQVLSLGEDFALDGAPDPYVVLSANDMGSGAGTLNLGRLKSKQGPATFTLPAGTDLAKYSRVLIWCKKYNVTLGQAELAAPDKMMHN
jgi:hypothetical protein